MGQLSAFFAGPDTDRDVIAKIAPVWSWAGCQVTLLNYHGWYLLLE